MVAIRDYELLFIINPQLEEEERNAIITRIKDLITEQGTLVNADEWGNRKLAYEIDDQTDGYYILINFNAASDFPLELDRILKITDGVLKHLIIKKEK